MKVTLTILFSCLVVVSHQRSTPQDASYVAAVVEYEVSRNVEHNTEKYKQLIAEAARQNADIVIFPELTLTNSTTSFAVPIHGLLKTYPIPALYPEYYHDLLVQMSAAARQNEIYLVINTQELMDCRNNDTGEFCPEAKEYLFNTNVVFDRTGAVIDRYRKINLFGEASRTPALNPDLGIFTTDFGVTFGHFVCFDLMFQIPAIQVVQKHKLTDVIFTTMWFSELPFLTAVEIQEAYAYAMNVNFLAAGANNVGVGSAGSGIFSGKAGALVSIMPGVPTTRLLVSRVPKVPGQVTEPGPGPIYDNPTDHDSLVLITDPSLPAHVSRVLTDGFQEFTLFDKDVSCTFRVRMKHGVGNNPPHYRAVVQDGSNTYSRREIGVAGCLIVACMDDDINTCTYRFDPKTTKSGIQELKIQMRTYPHQYNSTLKCDNVVYFPMSIRANKFPLSSNNFTFNDMRRKIETEKENGDIRENEINNIENYENKDGREEVIFEINEPEDELMAFGIWGRIYTRDVDHNKFDTYAANSTAIFEELSITATFPSPTVEPDLECDDSAVFPVALKTNIMPLEPISYTYEVNHNEKETVYNLILNEFDYDLYNFAVWGRVFATDGQDADPPLDDSAGVRNIANGLIIFVAFLMLLR